MVSRFHQGSHRQYKHPAKPGEVSTSATFPRRLGDTGLFVSVKDHEPAPGVIPFSVNAAQWADYATAEPE